MDIKLQKYYEDRFAMMSTQGWIDLIDDIQVMIDSTDTIQGIDDIKKLHFKQGELNMMNWLKTLKQVSELAYTELQNARPE